MEIRKVVTVSFSPTGTSKKIVEAIASGISGVECSSIDLTFSIENQEKTFQPDELVIIGVPVYAGRVAPLAVERLKAIRGNNSLAVVVVLYGNREYEDALIELRDLAAEASFRPVAASAFIGEHSFSNAGKPIAEGRPDSADLAAAAEFGRSIGNKILELKTTADLTILQVPGNVPYKEAMGSLPFTPKVDEAQCTLCGLCMETCPSGAIAIDETVVMDVDRCVFCCACIKNCPENAVEIDAAPLLEKRQWLHENYAARKEAEFFL
ncbi:MAG: 4Fe-4S binding protein [Desulforhopalus sp.]